MKLKVFITLIVTAIILSGCFAKSTDKFVTINGKTVKVEIADTGTARVRGLSDREILNENEGMLFVFQEKNLQSFWMKNMKFNLDIIWIDDDKIVKISKNLPAEGEAPVNSYSSDIPVNYVLEVIAGWADKNNIKIGDKIIYSL